MELKLFQRWEIDDDKWNNHIASSPQGNVYGLTWYLDAMTDGHWQALVSKNYLTLMPFYKKSKYLIPYITQPFLCQRLGIFNAENNLSTLEIDIFYRKLANSVLKYDILTAHNIPSKSNHKTRENHILNLEFSYDGLSKNYNRNTKRNLTAAANIENHIITDEVEVTDLIDFFRKNDPTLLLDKHYKKVMQLIKSALVQNNGFLLVAKENNELRAAAFYIEFGSRIYFLICASDVRGKETKSMYYLIDDIIRKYSGQSKIFDFTGSNIKSIAQRNLGFGAEVETYFHVHGGLFM